MTFWTQERTALLRELYKAGATRAHMAERLGCGTNAIAGKINREFRNYPSPWRNRTRAKTEAGRKRFHLTSWPRRKQKRVLVADARAPQRAPGSVYEPKFYLTPPALKVPINPFA